MDALKQGLPSDAGERCLNCATPLAGPFCAGCGQKARVNRSLAAFFSDLVAGLFNFESRFWRTLPMLVWCPGDLTRRYVEGQRARFISPIALYLFSVFLMFAVLGATAGGIDTRGFSRDVDRQVAEGRTRLAGLEQERASATRRGAETGAIDRRIAAQRSDIERLERLRTNDSSPQISFDGSQVPPWLLAALRRAEADPRAFATHVQEAASRYSWALIPLSLPFMFLLFPLRGAHVFDHAVFVTYSLSFMMLLILLGSLMVVVGASALVPGLLLLPPIHMYRQLRGAYGLRWWSALLRTVALLCLALFALAMFAAAVIALGLFG